MLQIFDMLFPPREDEVQLRGVTNDFFLSALTPHTVNVTQPETIALLPFHEPIVRSAIHEAKYHGSSQAFSLLAMALSEYLSISDDTEQQVSHLIPIPLGTQRRKERGFNQTEEVLRRALHLLSKIGADSFSIDTDLLQRTRETPSQVSLPRHMRKENMRGAFIASRPANPNHTYILIDDVLTTGATLQSAINALRAAGATQIIPLALAH